MVVLGRQTVVERSLCPHGLQRFWGGGAVDAAGVLRDLGAVACPVASCWALRLSSSSWHLLSPCRHCPTRRVRRCRSACISSVVMLAIMRPSIERLAVLICLLVPAVGVRWPPLFVCLPLCLGWACCSLVGGGG